MSNAPARTLAAAAFAGATALAACGQDNRYVAPPPPKVTVATPVRQSITRYLELTGNTAAVNSADLVARVSGFVQEVDYQDGAPVKKGDLLFTIEPQPYDLKLQQAQAQVSGSQAKLKDAQAILDRQAELLARQSSPQAQYDQALANRDGAQASLLQAQVDTRLAELNVDYAHVKAPFDGLVSARQVSAGQYVGASGSPTVLATITQYDPIYVNFNISEQDVLRLRAEVVKLGLTRDDLKQVPIEVGLQTESGYPHSGKFDYAAPTVNASTGTLAVRGVFANTDRILLPGYFVRVRIPVEQQPDALLVPDSALGSDQGGRYLLVVDKDDVVAQRKVDIGPLVGELRVIDRGLKPDDRVVTAGVLRAVPGQKVDPQAASTAAAK
jgi:RND family efflux transporter MFP subunit